MSNEFKNMVEWINLAIKALKFSSIFPTLLFRLGFINNVTIKTKTLGKFELHDDELKIPIISQIINFQEYVLKNDVSNEICISFKKFINSILQNDEIIDFDGIKFLKNIHIFVLSENFYESGNSPFNYIKNKIIIDVGANIADTALNFAKKGCEVYAFEPVPDIYEIAIKNIELNANLKPQIHLYNKAISDKNGKINIYYDELSSLGSSSYSKKGNKYEIDAISLDNVIDNLKNQNIVPNLLQMDCEGAEFDIIPNTNLSIFDELIIEYHSNLTNIPPKILIDEIKKQGFEIQKIYNAPLNNSSLEDLGIIHAINKFNK